MTVGANKGRYFMGACILAAGLLLKSGAPLVPIVLGVAAAAFLTWKRLPTRPKHLPR